ncbi:MAG: GNAT family N-acetyltransferase [Clostridiales bacterium]|nr:GNAT family N-acetyltransferase [Clostridiales bacterium]
MIVEITDPNEKQAIARSVLEDLTDWFGIEESREAYISGSAGWTFLAAREDDKTTGFLCLKETGNATVEIAVMGVMKGHHGHGTGRRLVEKAIETARNEGYEFIQVKTVKMGVYEDYDRTNLFYISCGFKELEVFPLLWDEHNPCQVYIMSLTEKTGLQ